ncbi:hypothetical protein L249_5236 [Ophiocordyceps polyrhachis-furcata BCC 54312]|uniref:Uncharacterized protein n=1 Tax=Ophiocordyceps polyrhachis-furcata BCC 54312 TaxID=1330021 RepID=A0A367L8C5_9HYPO|nr:hypothetical protein L249_5236 [Ophiocordyceps polyrhachis-furcata BCC 54312]
MGWDEVKEELKNRVSDLRPTNNFKVKRGSRSVRGEKKKERQEERQGKMGGGLRRSEHIAGPRRSEARPHPGTGSARTAWLAVGSRGLLVNTQG